MSPWTPMAHDRRRISLPDLLSVIERCLRHPSTSGIRQKVPLANISATPMRPRDILLSGVRKSCRRWFLRVFSPSRSIGTPEPVSKGLSGGQYEMGVGRGANGLRSGGRHFVLHRHEFVSLRSCRPPFSLCLSLTAVFSTPYPTPPYGPTLPPRSLFLVSPSAPPRPSSHPEKLAPAARGTEPSSKNTSRPADPKSESTLRISRAILSDQRAIGLTIFLFVALAAQVIFKATFGNGDSNTGSGLFSRVAYLFMRGYRRRRA